MAKEDISHLGRIIEITPDYISVEIISESACSSCHAAALCGMSEYAKKAVQVPTGLMDDFAVGDEVDVLLCATMGHKAVWMAYVIPLVVFLAFLLLPICFGAGELFSAALAFMAVAVYYLCIYLCRDSLRSEYVFRIKKRNH